MSSHHFVKEGQEPALFILDNIGFQYAESLLEWVPIVIVADHALESVLQWGIKIDIVLQHGYSFDALEHLAKDQGPVQILRCSNDDVVAQGLQFAIKEGYDAVNLLGRPREELFREVENSARELQVGIYSVQEKWSLISCGKFEKWMQAGSVFLFKSTSAVQTEGVIQKDEYWETGAAGMVMVRSETKFWIGEPR